MLHLTSQPDFEINRSLSALLSTKDSELNWNKLVVKICEASDIGVLNPIRNEAKILPKVNCSIVNKLKPTTKIQTQLILEHAGKTTLT